MTPVSAVRRWATSSARRGTHLFDLLGNEPPGLDEAAAFFDRLEVLPRLLGQLFGEILNEPRPGHGIEHPPDVAFLQQQLGVTGDPAGETCRERGAQHVLPRVALGHHRHRCDGMHRGGATVGLPGDRGHPCPKLACRAQRCNDHELIVVGGKAEAALPQRIPNTKAAVAEEPQIRNPAATLPASSHDAHAPRLWKAGPSMVIARTPPS